MKLIICPNAVHTDGTNVESEANTSFACCEQGFLLSNEVHVFGYARTKISDDELRNRIRGYASDLHRCCSLRDSYIVVICFVKLKFVGSIVKLS